jgi:hypothetical protein
MGRIDDRVDALGDQIGSEALDAAKAADAQRNRRRRRVRSCAGERKDGRNVGFLREAPRERACLGRAAENEQAKALQATAP